MKSLIVSLLFLFTFNQVLICQNNISASADVIIEGHLVYVIAKCQ
jgi:hypothetical protein